MYLWKFRRRQIFSIMLAVTWVLPKLASATTLVPVPRVEAGSLLSHLLINLAIASYVIAVGLNFIFLFSGKKKLADFGRLITFLAVFFHASGYLLRWKELYDHGSYGWVGFPLSSYYEILIIHCLMLALTCLFLQIKSRCDLVAVFFLPFLMILLLVAQTTRFAGIYVYKYPSDLEVAYRLIVIVLLFRAVAYNLLTTAGLVSSLLVAARMSALKSLFEKYQLPSEQTLYKWNRKSMIVGVGLYFVSFVLGLFMSKTIWGVYWLWRLDEVLLTGVLIIYSYFAFKNIRRGWASSSATNTSIIGLCIIVITHVMALYFYSRRF